MYVDIINLFINLSIYLCIYLLIYFLLYHNHNILCYMMLHDIHIYMYTYLHMQTSSNVQQLDPARWPGLTFFCTVSHPHRVLEGSGKLLDRIIWPVSDPKRETWP